MVNNFDTMKSSGGSSYISLMLVKQIMKYLLWLALLIAVVVVVNEFAYIGQTSLAWVVIALAAAIGAVAIYLVAEKK